MHRAVIGQDKIRSPSLPALENNPPSALRQNDAVHSVSNACAYVCSTPPLWVIQDSAETVVAPIPGIDIPFSLAWR